MWLILIDFAPDVVIIYCNVGIDRVKNVLKIKNQKNENKTTRDTTQDVYQNPVWPRVPDRNEKRSN